jgi:amino acid transporter
MTPVKSVADVVPDPHVQRVRRARSFKRPGLLWFTALLYVVAFAAFVAFVVFALRMYLEHNKAMGIYALAAIGVLVIARVWASINSRNLTCHLCMGPVLHEKTCHKHHDAKRLPIFGYRAATVLSTLFAGGFSCMYCGTPFRLKK